MNILKIIKELYTGKENLVAQTAIFALVGIMAISFNEVISVFTGNTLYAIFTVPGSDETIIFSMLGIMIFIFFTGYIYKFIHENYECEKAQLPTISMDCFTCFAKIIPVIFVWGIYLGLAGYLGLILFGVNHIEFYAYVLFLLIILPFINMVFVRFAKDFKYNLDIFNPLSIAKIMKKTFVQVFLFILQFVALGAIISFLSGLGFKGAIDAQSRIAQLLCVLTVLCVSSYFQQVLNLAYYKGLTEIIKKNEV